MKVDNEIEGLMSKFRKIDNGLSAFKNKTKIDVDNFDVEEEEKQKSNRSKKSKKRGLKSTNSIE